MADPTPPEVSEPPEPVQDVYCFLGSHRPCSAECVAYETHAPDDREYSNKAWKHCMLLVNTHRASKHLVILASCGGKIVNYIADQLRTTQPPPPKGG